MRIDRMLAITIMLLNRERISAKELADKFEVSVRTIYRDIDAINLAGIPIVSYSGNSGGFGIMDNYKLDRQLLTLKDMFAILTALKGINSTLENEEIDAAIEKVQSLVPDEKNEELNVHFENLIIDILPWGRGAKYKEKLQAINKAVTGRLLLNYDYTNMKLETTNRTVESMTLLFKNYTWYLFAYCMQKQDYRIFKLSRMKQIKVLNEKFTRREKSYQDIFIDEDKSEKWIKIILRFSSRVKMKVEEYFYEEDISYNADGSIIVNVSFPDNEWVYSTILSFGEDVEVIEPAAIREVIYNKARQICKIYS